MAQRFRGQALGLDYFQVGDHVWWKGQFVGVASQWSNMSSTDDFNQIRRAGTHITMPIWENGAHRLYLFYQAGPLESMLDSTGRTVQISTQRIALDDFRVGRPLTILGTPVTSSFEAFAPYDYVVTQSSNPVFGSNPPQRLYFRGHLLDLFQNPKTPIMGGQCR